MIKKILVLLILTLSFANLSKSDDAKNFQIEGISLGDSALDHFSEEEINKNKKYLYKSSKYFLFAKRIYNSNIYDAIQLSMRNNDDKYIIENVSGKILFQDNQNACNKKRISIVKDITTIFSQNVKIKIDEGYKMPGDKTGRSINDATFFYFPNGSIASVECTDWTKEMKYKDNLKVRIFSKKYNDFLRNEAHK